MLQDTLLAFGNVIAGGDASGCARTEWPFCRGRSWGHLPIGGVVAENWLSFLPQVSTFFSPSLGLATADLETLRDNNLGRSCVVMLMATDGIPRDFGPEMPWEVQSEIWGFRSRAGGPAFVWSSGWRQMWSIEVCRLRRETSSMTITSGDQRYVACLSFCGAFYVSICMKLVYWNASLGNLMPLILYITSGGWKTRPLSQNQAGDVCFIWRLCR